MALYPIYGGYYNQNEPQRCPVNNPPNFQPSLPSSKPGGHRSLPQTHFLLPCASSAGSPRARRVLPVGGALPVGPAPASGKAEARPPGPWGSWRQGCPGRHLSQNASIPEQSGRPPPKPNRHWASLHHIPSSALDLFSSILMPRHPRS
jgi:hypothetical protein